jgi:hypothetical protein
MNELVCYGSAKLDYETVYMKSIYKTIFEMILKSSRKWGMIIRKLLCAYTESVR